MCCWITTKFKGFKEVLYDFRVMVELLRTLCNRSGHKTSVKEFAAIRNVKIVGPSTTSLPPFHHCSCWIVRPLLAMLLLEHYFDSKCLETHPPSSMHVWQHYAEGLHRAIYCPHFVVASSIETNWEEVGVPLYENGIRGWVCGERGG
jgi:hypothetical protein